ncbi:hypothetical protein [Kitasatospora sp. NPDC017646]|uniref:hypothetical protein n=1 Tax=Kitasatospora sp. NPDC017646 TaxID=3364024 RepID=UPI0037BACE1F
MKAATADVAVSLSASRFQELVDGSEALREQLLGFATGAAQAQTDGFQPQQGDAIGGLENVEIGLTAADHACRAGKRSSCSERPPSATAPRG